jgi:uncharacterized protein
MRLEDLKGKTALVTGASSGLGVEFSRQLAACGCHLILVARREEALATLKQELEAQHGVRVDLMPMDLAAAGAPERLYAQVEAASLSVAVLVNNAGLGLYGAFTEIPWEREKMMLELDIVTVAHLTRLFAPAMVRRKFGRVLNIASTGAFQPTPTYAAYAAAKSFVLSYSEAVNVELHGTGVTCTALCPGVTRTEFFQVSGQTLTLYQHLTMMDSAQVARIGLNAMARGHSSVVAGWLNALMAGSMSFIPRPWAARLAQWVMTMS